MSLLPFLALVACGAQRRADLQYDLAATERALETSMEDPSLQEPASYYGGGGGGPVLAEESDQPGLLMELTQSLAPEEAELELTETEAGSEPEETVPVLVESVPMAPQGPWQDSVLVPGVAGPSGESQALVKAIDELRYTMLMEARLADKQLLMDEMRKDIDAIPVSGQGASSQAVRTLEKEQALAKAQAKEQAALQKTALDAEKARVAALEERLGAIEATQAEQAQLKEQARIEEQALAEEQARAEQARAEQDALESEAVASSSQPLETAELSSAERSAYEQQLAAQRAQYEAENKELALAYKQLQDQTKLQEEAAQFERKQTRKSSRFQRWSWWATRKDGKKNARRGSRSDAIEAERLAEEQALMAQDQEAQSASWQEIQAARAALEGEQAQLRERETELSAERASLQGQQDQVVEQKRNLQAHLQGLESAQSDAEASGEKLDAERQAELARMHAELEDLRAVEAKLAQTEVELNEVQERAKEVSTLKQEMEGLRQTAARAEGLEASLAEIEAQEQAKAQRLEEALAPLREAGIEVTIQGGKAQLSLPSDLLFASGSATLSKDGQASLVSLAEALQKVPKARVQIEGHTDNVPTRGSRYKTNWDLAYARSTGVLQALLKAGLAAERLSAASYGETRPVADNTTADGRAQNRRIELIVELPE